MAQRNNLGMKSQRLKLEEARTADSSSWNAFVPQVSLTAALSRSNLADADRTQPDFTGLPAYAASGFSGPFPTLTIPTWVERNAHPDGEGPIGLFGTSSPSLTFWRNDRNVPMISALLRNVTVIGRRILRAGHDGKCQAQWTYRSA